MALPLKNHDGQRYVGDAERRIVHDTHHGECEDCIVEDLIARGAAVSFRPDSLDQAFDEGYDYCDWCFDSSDPDSDGGAATNRRERRFPELVMVA